MNLSFFKSFQPILKPLSKVVHKHRLEVFFISVAFLLTMISLIIFIIPTNIVNQKEEIVALPQTLNKPSIYVDIGGAVIKPDVYEVTSGARIKQAVVLAGGLAENAHLEYFARNFNLARILTDQEKIYVPSVEEINNGIITESPQTLNYAQPASVNQTQQSSNETTSNVASAIEQSTLININSASVEELDTLPGIGAVTSQKIIQNRPYSSIEDLLNKKVVKKNVYEQIKGLIIIN